AGSVGGAAAQRPRLYGGSHGAADAHPGPRGGGSRRGGAPPVSGARRRGRRAPGVVEWEPGGAVRFKFMARDGAGIVVGDTVVASGQGNVFPKGLPVGRVIAVEDKGSALFHFAVLVPVVDFARVEEVLLLTGQTTQDLAGLFPRRES